MGFPSELVVVVTISPDGVVIVDGAEGDPPGDPPAIGIEEVATVVVVFPDESVVVIVL